MGGLGTPNHQNGGETGQGGETKRRLRDKEESSPARSQNHGEFWILFQSKGQSLKSFQQRMKCLGFNASYSISACCLNAEKKKQQPPKKWLSGDQTRSYSCSK